MTVFFRLLTILTLMVMFTILGGLGTWQVMRFFEKKAMPPFEQVTFNGHFVNDETRFWMGRSHKGVSGVYVLTPFIDENGKAILVNRGWAGGMDVKPAEHKTAYGLKVPFPKKSTFTPEKPYDGKRWFFLDPPAILAHAGFEDMHDFYMVLSHETAGTIPVHKEAKPHNPHFGYAVTWFSFMLILATIVFLIIIRRKKS